MSYFVQCQVCGHRMPVSDPTTPPDIQCPECASFYSLFPVNDRPPPYVPRVLRELGFDPAAPRPAPPTAAETRSTPLESEQGTSAERRLAVLEPAGRPAPRPAVPQVAGSAAAPRTAVRRPPAEPESEDERPAVLRLLDPVGPGALILGGAAAACAVTGRFPLLIVPLAAGGLLLGLVTVVLTGGARGSRLWPLAGAAVCGAVLLTVLAPGFRSARPRAQSDATIRIVPLTGHEGAGELQPAEWADASRAVLQQGAVGVQVVSVTLGSIEVQTGPRKKTVTPEKYLVVRLRAQRVVAKLTLKADEPDPPLDRPPVTLTDEAGKAFRQAAIHVEADPGRPAVSTFGAAEEVYVFEAPLAGAKRLRLEVPAAAWGGTGSFRFAIPASMIRPGLTRGGRPGPAAVP
jgi:hypothetical protein